MEKIAPAIFFILWFSLLFHWENRRPLRIIHDNKYRRLGINLTYFFTNALLSRGLFILILFFAEKHRLVHFSLGSFRSVILLIFLDLTLYYWHWLNHRIPFLWRFHSLHHSDRDLDVSTAFRFHFGEFFFSYLFKTMLILFAGVSAVEVLLFDSIVTVFVMFHHSNIKLPAKLEALLKPVIVLPSHHHVHHSNHNLEMNSHYASLFSFWDKLHKTDGFIQKKDEMVMGLESCKRTPSVISGWFRPFSSALAAEPGTSTQSPSQKAHRRFF